MELNFNIDDSTGGASLAMVYPTPTEPFPVLHLDAVVSQEINVPDRGKEKILKFLFKNMDDTKRFVAEFWTPASKKEKGRAGYLSYVTSTIKEIFDAFAADEHQILVEKASGWDDFCDKVVLAFDNGRGKDMPIYKNKEGKSIPVFLKITISLSYVAGGFQLGKSPFIERRINEKDAPKKLVVVKGKESIDSSLLDSLQKSSSVPLSTLTPPTDKWI